MKILTVVGARPQFIKSAPVSLAIREAGHREFLLHTGQHYDYGMSQVFFEEMGIPEPDVNLGIGSGSHARQTAQMLVGIEETITSENPDWVMVYGDTNSTLAAALAACKIGVRLAHVEAGLRSFNRTMPEEHNRVLTDHCADLLFCPTRTAVENLAREGITQSVRQVGDTMYDALLQFSEIARQRPSILRTLGLTPKRYLLATVHRAYNTDNTSALANLFSAFSLLGETIVLPIHPRTRARMDSDLTLHGLLAENVKLIDPVSYLDMLSLQENADAVLTDSGGMQKEAYLLGVPCFTLRPETEWVETLSGGWNTLTGSNTERIVDIVRRRKRPEAGRPPEVFGRGDAARRIVEELAS